jgi:polyhydroxyalkanoate synthesis regulator phasin
MSERTKLLKKAVLTSVGASTDADRIKQAISQAMDDLVKVGQELLEDLEDKGKIKTESVQNFLKNLQGETAKRTNDLEKTVSEKVQVSMKKAVKEIGLITREDYDELLERLSVLEEALVGTDEEGGEGKKARTRSKKSNG